MKPRIDFPTGTRVTAQSWFDVRYRRSDGVVETHRFTSLRAVLYTR